MPNCKFIDETGVSGVYFSNPQATRNGNYSVHVIVDGVANYDIELQASLNQAEWVTIKHPVDSVITGLDASTPDGKSVLYDQSNGHHRYIRVKITINSGTPDIRGHISR